MKSKAGSEAGVILVCRYVASLYAKVSSSSEMCSKVDRGTDKVKRKRDYNKMKIDMEKTKVVGRRGRLPQSQNLNI